MDLILGKYWSQVILLLGIVSYFLKRAFDLKSKKLEISFTVFQTNKIKAFEAFVSICKILQLKVSYLSKTLTTIKYDLSALSNELRDNIFSLNQAVGHLEIYIPNHELEYIKTIHNNFTLIFEELETISSSSNANRETESIIHAHQDRIKRMSLKIEVYLKATYTQMKSAYDLKPLSTKELIKKGYIKLVK